MPVENHGLVDAIGVVKESGAVALTISNHVDWEDSRAHLLSLQEKLNRYLAFIESGELPTPGVARSRSMCTSSMTPHLRRRSSSWRLKLRSERQDLHLVGACSL